MNNVLLDPLPTTWNGYELNTSFRIGVQISLIRDDADIPSDVCSQIIIELLFCDDDGTMREHPQDAKELNELVQWFLNGWHHDRKIASDKDDDQKRLIDYDIDQYRIYADFLKVYGIDLNTAELHWWVFQGLLWNMPHDQSSFMQVIEIRTKKPSKNAGAEERRRIEDAHKRYDLAQRKVEKQYTTEEEKKIDTFDAFVAKAKAARDKQKQDIEEALKGF